MANTTNGYGDIVAGTLVEFNGSIYTVGKVFRDTCYIIEKDKTIKVNKADCKPL